MKKNLLLLSTLPLAFSLQAEKQQTRPNIVVFLSDDASPDMGCYGNNGIKTPTIDSLAASGVRFANAYLTAPQSSPSRTSMISGQFAHTINTEDLEDKMPADVLCLPTYLKQLGYKTGIMLKDHMGPNVNFEERITGGYNKDGSGLWSTTVPAFGDFVERAGTNPFFVWVGYIDPHRGYTRTMCPQVNPVEGVTVAPFLFDSDPTRRDLAELTPKLGPGDVECS